MTNSELLSLCPGDLVTVAENLAHVRSTRNVDDGPAAISHTVPLGKFSFQGRVGKVTGTELKPLVLDDTPCVLLEFDNKDSTYRWWAFEIEFSESASRECELELTGTDELSFV